MSDDVFDLKLLSDKLSKLNGSRKSIESLSGSCISQRKNAKQIVEIWHKSFKSAKQAQHIHFLMLANDIVQNSKREGSEFVNEFWKVILSALKYVNEHGDDKGKKATLRLVDIWDQRRVFGSRGQNLKDIMLGKSLPPQSASSGKTPTSNPNPIKIAKRDTNSLRLKLAVGSAPEKIMTAFHLVHDEHATEGTAINNCEGAVNRVEDLEREIETQGVQPGSSLLDEIQEQENVLQECVNQLETAEKSRMALISQLKEALQDQESRLDVIHSQLQVARHKIDHAVTLRKKLASASLPAAESTSFAATTHATDEETKKAAAAAVAAKLAASTSSAQMLSSVLSSLVAQEAASNTNNSSSSSFNPSVFATNSFPPEKRPKLENPVSGSDMTNSDYFNQTVFPPLPPLPPSSVQSSGLMMGGNGNGLPYVYGASSLPPPLPPLPPPSMPSHVSMGMMMPLNHPPPQLQQQAANGGYYRPPGIGFYGQNHQSNPPALPHQ